MTNKEVLISLERVLKSMEEIVSAIPDRPREFSVEKQKEAEKYLYDKATSTPVSIPVGHKIPESQNVAIQRILLASGAITREQFEAALGVTYDGDFNDDDELDIPPSVDEDFEQSRFASYTDIEVPNVETKSVDKAPAVQKEPAQVASDNSDNSGGDNDKGD